MKEALRDASFYACPSGHGHSPRSPLWHAIVDRPGNKWGADRGPACGIPFHTEWSETEAAEIPERQRCTKSGCKEAFLKLLSEKAANAN